MNIVPTTIRIEEELKEDIEVLAEKEKRSFNKMVEYILQKYVDENKEEE